MKIYEIVCGVRKKLACWLVGERGQKACLLPIRNQGNPKEKSENHKEQVKIWKYKKIQVLLTGKLVIDFEIQLQH